MSMNLHLTAMNKRGEEVAMLLPRLSAGITRSAMVARGDKIVVSDVTVFVQEIVHRWYGVGSNIAPNSVAYATTWDRDGEGAPVTDEQFEQLVELGFRFTAPAVDLI